MVKININQGELYPSYYASEAGKNDTYYIEVSDYEWRQIQELQEQANILYNKLEILCIGEWVDENEG